MAAYGAEPHAGGLCRASCFVQGDAASLDKIISEKKQIIAGVLGKSLVLSVYEKEVTGKFDGIAPVGLTPPVS